MKIFTITLFLLVSSVQNIVAIHGEIWFYIDDNSNTNYKVVASRISTSEPLFGYNFMEVGNNQYDEVTSDIDVLGNPLAHPWDVLRGFDYLRDPHVWPLIGEGKLEFSIYRDDILLFQFGIDLVHYPIPPPFSFADIKFYFTATTNSLVAYTNGIYTEILNNSFVNCWELQEMERNISSYVNNIELTNLVGAGVEYNIKTSFNNAIMGFPYNDVQLGQPYNPGDTVRLWRGVNYGISTTHSSYTKNGIIYNFRNWIGYENYSTSATLRVLAGTDEFRSMYYSTIPLTIANNLEGGSSNNDYEITWQTPPITQTWQYGIPFNALKYEDPRNDIYSATASDQFQALGTTWWFHHWDNGSTNSVRPNIQVTAPTTITAFYKGNLRSNDQNGISSGSQRKLVRTDNGIYHLVYESMGHIWYTHSLTGNFNGQWNQDICISDAIGNLAKNPAMDFEVNNIKIVFETDLGDEAAIYLLTLIPDVSGNYYVDSAEEVTGYSLSYFGSAKPAIAYNSVVVFIAYRKNTSDGLYQKSKILIAGNWQWKAEEPIPNTSSYSFDPSVAGISNDIHLVYQHSLGVRYILAVFDNYGADYINYAIVSTGSGYTNNYSPSISLAKNAYPVVSWIGYTDSGGGGINKVDGDEASVSKVVVRRGSSGSWSSFFKAGNNAATTNNNSSNTTVSEQSVITWSEGTAPNYNSKWVRRVDGSYTDEQNLSHNGKQNQVSNGTNLENIKGTIFSTTSSPFMLSLSTTNFNQQFGGGGITKVGELIELSYGR